jgi:hypothetical protein
VVRALWAARLKAGQVLGWVSPAAGVGSRAPTLRDRLPDDLRSAPTGPAFRVRTRTPLYLLDDEFAAEIANRTMHGVLHVGWVPDRTRATSSGPGADSTPGTAAPAGLRSGGRLADSLSGSRGPPHVARLVVPVVVDPADGE